MKTASHYDVAIPASRLRAQLANIVKNNQDVQAFIEDHQQRWFPPSEFVENDVLGWENFDNSPPWPGEWDNSNQRPNY
jgi:hypothetical protein